MQVLTRSWRTLRQLSPAERKQLATAVGAEGAEDILGKLAAYKGRVGPAFLAPALEKFKGMDPDALGRLIDVIRDPVQRREVLQKSARAVGEVLNDEPVGASEEQPVVDDQPEAEPEPDVEVDVDVESADSHQATERTALEEQPPKIPTVEPYPESPVDPPGHVVVPPPLETSCIEHVRDAPSLRHRLALAREALQGAEGWTVDQLRALIEVFPQDWARRRILVDMLKRRIPRDLAQAVDLVESLETRASRRWCVSLLLHEWQPSETDRHVLRELV
jgi:hypothetical protein